MTSSERTARSLYNILRQERDKGFDDSTVIGGLDAFLKPASLDLGRVLDDIPLYGSLTPAERSKWADRTVEHIRRHLIGNGRTPASPRSESTARPAQPSSKPPTHRRVPRDPLKMSDGVSSIKGVLEEERQPT